MNLFLQVVNFDVVLSRYLILYVLFGIVLGLVASDFEDPNNPWNLPVVFPSLEFDSRYALDVPNYGGKIPPRIWINMREIPPKENFTQYYQHLQNILNTAPSWTAYFMDEGKKDEFMRTFFKNTSILWAYEQISEDIRVAKSDIWRYCALYRFGGFYLDDDAYIDTPLDQV